MRIVNKLVELRTSYKSKSIQHDNGAILIEPSDMPKCRHMLFPGLKKDDIDKYLVENYNNPFPHEYAEFLQVFNGANLCSVRIKAKAANTYFAESLLTIYGVPRTKPFNRPADMEEPFDVRIEDLARNKKIPNTWLKCAAYDETPKFDRVHVFIDTSSGAIYACHKNEFEIIREWDNLDECLCDLFDELSIMPLEYEL